MNIALGALVILLLLLPALFFRLGFYMVRAAPRPDPPATPTITEAQTDSFYREQAKKTFINVLGKLNFSETLFFFSIIPLLLHSISLWVLSWFGCEVDYQQLLRLFSSNVGIVAENKFFAYELFSFLVYNIAEATIGFFLGWLLTKIIMTRPNLLRGFAGDDVWFKLFRGLLLKEDERKMVDAVLVDILCETKETSVIYSGFLEKFNVKENNEIEYITLRYATRRDSRQGSQVTETAGSTSVATVKTSVFLDSNGPINEIPGKYFTVPGSKIINVNVTYLHYQYEVDPKDNKTIINDSWVKLQ